MNTTSMKAKSNAIYDRVVDMIFCGRFAPGAKLVEEELASALGVSRVPVRETLAKLVGQGLLVGGGKGQGVRLREYTVEEVRQLYEYREALEGVAAAAAARGATATDLTRMEIICEQAEKEIADVSSRKWPDLDYHFHLALAEAGHNSRISYQLRLLVTECRYLFFIYPHPSHVSQLKTQPKDAAAYLRSVQADHLKLLELVKAKNPDEAEHKARADMRKSAERMARLMITGSLQLEDTPSASPTGTD
jgi:DNA-binding GntR family transcriptional regulator